MYTHTQDPLIDINFLYFQYTHTLMSVLKSAVRTCLCCVLTLLSSGAGRPISNALCSMQASGVGNFAAAAGIPWRCEQGWYSTLLLRVHARARAHTHTQTLLHTHTHTAVLHQTADIIILSLAGLIPNQSLEVLNVGSTSLVSKIGFWDWRKSLVANTCVSTNDQEMLKIDNTH